jgi:hypothetical protein
MNMIDWLRATAEWMRKDRPDLFETNADALNALNDMVESVRISTGAREGVETGGYVLLRSEDDGVEDWTLSKKISSFVLFPEDDEAEAFGWVKEVDLPNVADWS